jgi:O-antigen/teichoic acid export membrane protein
MTLAYLLWIVQIQGRIADALGKTKISESLGIIFKLFLVVTFAALFVSQELGIRSIVTLQIALLFPQIVTVAILIPTGLSHLREVAFEGLVSHLKGFARGTGLVFFSSALLVFTNLLDRWLLQRFAGSTEQGYFGFAHQLGNLCFLFAAALLPLVQREFSLAHASGGDAEVLKKCKMFAPIALIIVSFVACFLVANAKIVLSLVAGNSFLASEATVVIALLHAVFQVFVQIYISLLFSLNQTRTYSVIFAVQALLGIPVSLLILAPHRFGGFEAGAFGLSLKCFVSQLIALNFGLFLSMRKLGGKFGPYLLLQVTTPALCLILGFSAGIFSPAKHTPWLHFILSGILYSGAVLCIAIRWPQAFFLERRVLAQPIEWVQRRLGFGAKVV